MKSSDVVRRFGLSVSFALWVYQPIRIRPPLTGVSASTESDAVSREVAAVAAIPAAPSLPANSRREIRRASYSFW